MSMQGMGDPKEMGRGLLRQGQFDEAAAALREAVAMDATDEESWRLLGGALASKGDAASAVDAFKRAVDLAPMAGRSHYNLALAYQSAGRLSDAKGSLERALSLDPGYEQARTRLAEVDRQMGASAPVAAPVGLANVGGGGLSGLASVGAAPPPESGHTNIGGGNTSTLSSLGGLSGVGGTASTDEGHTNIGGGNSRALGGLSGAPPSSAGPSLRTDPPPSYGGSGGSGGSAAGGAYAPPPSLGMAYGQGENTSGMKADVPGEIRGTNWGAFFLNWIWAFNHKLPVWGGIGLALEVLSFFIPGVGLVLFGIAIYLATKGNELGWQNRRFQSVEDFKECQKKWLYWGLGLLVIRIAFVVVVFVVVGAAALMGQRSGVTPR